jgi:hypothetical protein
VSKNTTDSALNKSRRRANNASSTGSFGLKSGGADRNRTCDLLIANETLYQLSYDPIPPMLGQG